MAQKQQQQHCRLPFRLNRPPLHLTTSVPPSPTSSLPFAAIRPQPGLQSTITTCLLTAYKYKYTRYVHTHTHRHMLACTANTTRNCRCLTVLAVENSCTASLRRHNAASNVLSKTFARPPRVVQVHDKTSKAHTSTICNREREKQRESENTTPATTKYELLLRCCAAAVNDNDDAATRCRASTLAAQQCSSLWGLRVFVCKFANFALHTYFKG